jgi:hypothetical protein
MKDSILNEIHRHRDEIATRSGNDLNAIVEYYRQQEAKSGRRAIKLPPQRLEPVKNCTK